MGLEPARACSISTFCCSRWVIWSSTWDRERFSWPSIARTFLGQHGADLGQRESELLTLEDDGEAGAVAGIVDARCALAARREQAAILVETQSP